VLGADHPHTKIVRGNLAALREANTCIVNHHHSLELARVFGGGTMSSSDGQRFPVRGKSLTGREMTVFGGQVLSTYTHVSTSTRRSARR